MVKVSDVNIENSDEAIKRRAKTYYMKRIIISFVISIMILVSFILSLSILKEIPYINILSFISGLLLYVSVSVFFITLQSYREV